MAEPKDPESHLPLEMPEKDFNLFSSPESSEEPPLPNPEETRREFIKKLTYVTPLLTTFLLDDDASGKKKTKKKKKKKKKTSPVPHGDDDDDDDDD